MLWEYIYGTVRFYRGMKQYETGRVKHTGFIPVSYPCFILLFHTHLFLYSNTPVSYSCFIPPGPVKFDGSSGSVFCLCVVFSPTLPRVMDFFDGVPESHEPAGAAAVPEPDPPVAQDARGS